MENPELSMSTSENGSFLAKENVGVIEEGKREKNHRRQGKQDKARVFRLVILVLASVWLVASLVVSFQVGWGKTSTPALAGISYDEINSRSQRSMYGGDAYTGIQNAAADTESAVVNASNAVNATNKEIAQVSARYDARIAEWESQPIRLGMAGIIASLGMLGFIYALANFGRVQS